MARARGFPALAAQTGLTRQTLRQALGPAGNPRLSTLTAVLEALGLRLAVKRAA